MALWEYIGKYIGLLIFFAPELLGLRSPIVKYLESNIMHVLNQKGTARIAFEDIICNELNLKT